MSFGTTDRPVRRVAADGATAPPEADAVVVEEPLEVRLGGETLVMTLRTPGDDARLALGFLFAEGIISARAEVLETRPIDGPEGLANAIDVVLRPGAAGAALVAERAAAAKRGTMTTSACGVCGRRTIADLVARAGRVADGAPLALSVLAGATEALRRSQSLFAATGAIHGAAALDAAGSVLAAAEDVGRHNAVDKVVGRLLDEGTVARAALLVVSGRLGFEIVQKAAVAGIPVVAGVGGPSSLAVDLAGACGIALAGFLRGGRFNLYSHPGRLSGLGGA